MKPKKKKHYIDLVHFLGKTLGSNHEIILHLIDEDGTSIAAIENNHISGRTLDSPVTGFALELMKKNKEMDTNFVTNYKARNKVGKEIKGSTFLIKDEEDHLEGLLCINIDNSIYQKLSDDILQLANLSSPISEVVLNSTNSKSTPSEAGEGMVEILSNSIQEIIYETIDPKILDGKYTLSTEAKIEMVEKLERKGIFQLKGAVSQVAEVLNVSEPTIYRYLKMITNKG
ncbi:PAS domain-containing protein [Jeotgalibaca sp. MA1X17-3]|uniref:helix-turn-helix transcriptional regulator n=1 Tax=Jeotgalibaca sp. MA1X17-3 TaxID=2908211 RepID=UPI001F32B41C|nr:PAS domain-containing protein [Jeotgalibaca sp. MA1X17-3]UJF15590.1 PAS domain-containing protein [Jeotgalibaca sp. MA1X17-3]